MLLLLAGCGPNPGNNLSKIVNPGAQMPPNTAPSITQTETQSVTNLQSLTQAETGTQSQDIPQIAAPSPQTSFKIFPPLIDAKTRITKKPFGIYITPKTSPVQPERFTGYHTGVDFETFPDEQNKDVPVYAICTGSLLLKEWASGYGGVAVQQCTIADEKVTVIYGHVRLGSIKFTKGEQITAGSQLGVLGTGYSTETDGERKHLHLGIHKGTAVNILGYVQKKADLGNWLDARQFL